MTFAQRLYQSRADCLEAVEHGVANAAADGPLRDPVVGPVSFDRIDYPYTQVLPESTDYQGGNEFEHTIRLNCIFTRERDEDYLTFLSATFDAVEAALAALADVDCVYHYLPTTVEDFAGERDDTMLVMISVQLLVGSQVDLGGGAV